MVRLAWLGAWGWDTNCSPPGRLGVRQERPRQPAPVRAAPCWGCTPLGERSSPRLTGHCEAWASGGSTHHRCPFSQQTPSTERQTARAPTARMLPCVGAAASLYKHGRDTRPSGCESSAALTTAGRLIYSDKPPGAITLSLLGRTQTGRSQSPKSLSEDGVRAPLGRPAPVCATCMCPPHTPCSSLLVSPAAFSVVPWPCELYEGGAPGPEDV